MALSLRFRLRRRTAGSDAPPADHLQGEMAASEPGNAFYYGFGAGTGDLASASHLLFRSDGTRLWHDVVGGADGLTEFVGDGSALTGVTAASVDWSDVDNTPTTLAGYGITDGVTTSDPRLTDAREWTASTVSQAEAEAGTATTRRAWTAQRVWQAIAAWWLSASTAAGRALVTAADAAAQRTALGLGTLATQSGTFSGTSSGTNTGDQTITLTGDVTGSGTGSFAATLSATGVSAGTYRSVTVDAKGRVTAGTNPTTLAGYGITDAAPLSHVGAGGAAHANAVASGAAGFMTGADKAKLDGIATGATANSSDATLLARANHTGTQAASTITGLAAVATSGAYADLSGKPALFDGTWSSLTGKPSTFAPSAHNHPASEISDSTAAGRALLTGADAAAQRTSLGLGTAATANVTTSATDTTAGRVLRVGDSATVLSASPALRATVGGTANAITLTTGASLPSLPTGLQLRWLAGSANTGATTINVDGLGAQPCVTVTGAALPAGYIRTGLDTDARWNGTNWVVYREAESGSNDDGKWERHANGWQRCTRFVDLDGLSLTTAVGPLFRNESNLGPYAFPVPFASAADVYDLNLTISGSQNSTIRTSAICGRFRRGQATYGLAWDGIAIISAASATGTAGEITRISLSATGRWY